MTCRTIIMTAAVAGLFAAPALCQDDTDTPTHGFVPGFKTVYFPARFFDISTVTSQTATPAASYTYTATSNSTKWILAPTAEYYFSRHISLELDLHFHHTDYVQTTTLLSGEPPPSGATDNRNEATITQSSQINYWELPLVGHYHGLRSKGTWQHTYITAGPEFRHVGRIRTGNTYVYPDGTNAYNESPAQTMLRNQAGFVAGLGIQSPRFYKVWVSPEVRYVRWFGTTLQGEAFRSAQNQIEISFGFSF